MCGCAGSGVQDASLGPYHDIRNNRVRAPSTRTHEKNAVTPGQDQCNAESPDDGLSGLDSCGGVPLEVDETTGEPGCLASPRTCILSRWMLLWS